MPNANAMTSPSNPAVVFAHRDMTRLLSFNCVLSQKGSDNHKDLKHA